ncbi:MAG: fasciclin domain-containing protein [Dysgonamonadaceae bacterium]|jgi:hypothetical protein|nr:fasciclin domain-containing protein [Dysgonamonadaceae bacterium]
MKSIYKYLFVFAFAIGLAACDPWADDTKLKDANRDKTLLELLQANPEVSTFVSILQKTGYDQWLRSEQSLTVFAPVNRALEEMDLNDSEQLKIWVQNYMAFLSCFANQEKQFELTEIQMINGKTVPITGSVISGANVIKANLTGKNGVAHLIDNTIIDRKSIWEYLLAQTGYEQIDLMLSFNKEVMDMDKSVQTGVDRDGRPVYDTVWVMQNAFLEICPINDEKQLFTCILLENDALSALKTKYEKYFAQQSIAAQDSTIACEIASDLTLKHQTIEQAGRFASVKDILVDIDPAMIRASYQASNGWVYILRQADVKMYENKIKTQIIEAEDFVSRWDSENAWAIRYRDWASGGKDVMLKGFTRNTVEYDTLNLETGEIDHASKTFTFDTKYRDNDNVSNKLSNAYLKYTPVLYSTSYQIHWMAFDDMEKHYTGFSDTLQQPMILEQKLFVSFPGKPELIRETDAKISNHFSNTTVLAGKSIAGVHEETQVARYTVTTANEGLYMLDKLFEGTDAFGNQTTLICPAYGKAIFFVANTPREVATNSGIMFLDYIKLTPMVDPND